MVVKDIMNRTVRRVVQLANTLGSLTAANGLTLSHSRRTGI